MGDGTHSGNFNYRCSCSSSVGIAELLHLKAAPKNGACVRTLNGDGETTGASSGDSCTDRIVEGPMMAERSRRGLESWSR